MKCVKIMQSQSTEPSCEAIHKRLICPEFIILLRSFPSDISLWLLLLSFQHSFFRELEIEELRIQRQRHISRFKDRLCD